MQVNNNPPRPVSTVTEEPKQIPPVAVSKAWQCLKCTVTSVLAVTSITIALGTNLLAVAIIASIVATAAIIALMCQLSTKFHNFSMPIIHYVTAFLTDLALLPVAMISYFIPFSCWNQKEKSHKPTVVCVHGYMHRTSAWPIFLLALKKAKIPFITVELGTPTLASISDYAAQVGDEIKKRKLQDVVLLGHSMGGLVVSEYATKLALNNGINVKGVATIGSPLLGTKTAVIGFGKCAKEMEHNSQFTNELFQRIVSSNLEFLHMGSTGDSIVPIHSSQPQHPKARYETSNFLGHVGILCSQAFIDRTIKFYKEVTESTSVER